MELQDDPRYHVRNTDVPRTVAGWLIACSSAEQTASATSHPEHFVTKVATYNSHMPENLFLLCGDTKLDALVDRLTTAANDPPVHHDIPYRRVHCRMRNFIGRFADYVKEKEPMYEELVVFVDTNPALSIYTQLALCAMSHLIVPLNADDFSLQVSIHSCLQKA